MVAYTFLIHSLLKKQWYKPLNGMTGIFDVRQFIEIFNLFSQNALFQQ